MKSLKYNAASLMVLMVAAFVICCASGAEAACSWSGNTGTVASPYAVTDVAACVTDASSKTGDVVIQIPNSSVTWASSLTVNMRSGFANVPSLTIRGQNDCTLDANGISTACGTNIATPAISFTGSAAKRFRFAHARFTGNPGGNIFNMDGDSAAPTGGWRIDHIFFDNMHPGSRFVWFARGSSSYGLQNGVIDHVYVLNPGTIFFQYQPVTVDGGNAEWSAPLGLGTEAAVYIEDSKLYLTNGNPSAPYTEGQGGGRVVVRFNTIHNGYLDAHDAIIGNLRGQRKTEVYHNAFSYDANGSWVCPIIPRGGAGVAFNNSVADPNSAIGGSYPQFAIYRFAQAGGDPWGYAPNAVSPAYTKATLATSTTYTQSCTTGTACINIDGAGGYPARDQLGVDGNNPQVGGAAPFMTWGNTYNGNPASVNVTAGYGDGQILADRDYYIPATAVGGVQTSGIGTGTRATMNTLGCTVGRGFWVTDEGYWNSKTPSTASGVLYRCTETNVWTPYYVPYSYPHPLQGTGQLTLPTAPGPLLVN